MKSSARKLFWGGCLFAAVLLCMFVRFPVTMFVSPGQNDVLSISNITTLQYFYGTLTDAPHLYAFRIDTPTDISLALFVPDLKEQHNDISILVLRGKERGLDLVTRLEAARASWASNIWWSTGDTYRKGGVWHDTLEPGKYEIEISTPTNQGSYALALGTESTSTLASYGTLLNTLFTIKKIFHKSSVASVESPLVYVPLALVLWSSYGMWQICRKRKGVVY